MPISNRPHKSGFFRGLGTIRHSLLLIGALLVGIGVVTFTYPPDYLLMSPLWGILTAFSGLMCWVFLLTKSVPVGILAGATSITASVLRSLALVSTIGWSGVWEVVNPALAPDSGDDVGRFVGSMLWLLIGFLLLLSWPVLLLAVANYRGSLDSINVVLEEEEEDVYP